MLLPSQQRHVDAMPGARPQGDLLARQDECGPGSAGPATLIAAGALHAFAVLLALLAPDDHARSAVVLGSYLPSSPLRG